MSREKIVLAYSGGLDTSICIKWLEEKYNYDVITLIIDMGEAKDLDAVHQKALDIGAVKSVVIDGKALLADGYLMPALKANALYEGKYPLSSALSRPLISKLLVEVAEEEGAVAVAHGCTGKGNDQVRFEVSIRALNPDIKIEAPVREWQMTRDEQIAYAKEKGIPVPVKLDNPFSIDANIWGRACEAGVLENPWNEAPEAAFDWTNRPEDAPDEPEYVEIDFEKGIPVALNNEQMDTVQIIETLNEVAGKHGIGRLDHIENRLVGIKTREVYETPAALVLIHAHEEMEFLTQTREVAEAKKKIELEYAHMIYDGLWYSPLRLAYDAFINETQENVTGKVRVKLYKGNFMVIARQSPFSLYNEELATYEKGDMFDHNAAVGFIKLWGLPTEVYADKQKKTKHLRNEAKQVDSVEEKETVKI